MGPQLAKVDSVLIAALSKRMELAKLVQEWKGRHGSQPILRLEIEDARIAQFAEWAKARGLNQNFVRAVLYFIIAESCRVQISQLQSKPDEDDLYDKDRKKWYQFLKGNLLALTAQVAPEYDKMYDGDTPFATKSYLAFEENIIKKEINTLKALKNTTIAIDIGCATGRTTFSVAPYFDKVIGYDISPEMIKVAAEKRSNTGVANVEFKETDIENGIPLEDDSVSLVVMNLGTASDVMDTRRIILGIKRVLKKDGRFVLSFYNTGALFYHYFIPWPVSLTAEINLVKHSLDVHRDEKIFQIYARPYTIREAKHLLMKEGLIVSSVLTYPTVASILPNEFFTEDGLKESIKNIDNKLANLDKGAYIIITGRKNN